MSQDDPRHEGVSLAAYEESLRTLAQEFTSELAAERWTVTVERLGGNANDPGPLGFLFANPVSKDFQHGIGRRPKILSRLRAGLTEMLATEREFSVVRQLPPNVAHPELLASLRFMAFAYRWTPPIVEQVAEAMVGGRALELDEAVWLVSAGPAIWGPIPDWVDERWRR